jgi:hypothetical protein
MAAKVAGEQNCIGETQQFRKRKEQVMKMKKLGKKSSFG